MIRFNKNKQLFGMVKQVAGHVNRQHLLAGGVRLIPFGVGTAVEGGEIQADCADNIATAIEPAALLRRFADTATSIAGISTPRKCARRRCSHSSERLWHCAWRFRPSSSCGAANRLGSCQRERPGCITRPLHLRALDRLLSSVIAVVSAMCTSAQVQS
jgi:hypothetical protein